MRCHKCEREFTHPNQYLWDEVPSRYLRKRGELFERVLVCRGIVQCGRRRIARFGRESVAEWERRWLRLDVSPVEARRLDRQERRLAGRSD